MFEAGTSSSTEALLDDLRAGSQHALGAVYDEHHVAVRSFALRLLGQPESAEDLVHDVFVRLPELAQKFRGDSALRTFLFSVVANRARHFARNAARRRAAAERLAHEPTQRPAEPGAQVERGDLAAALHDAMEKLPMSYRLTFVLCHIEEKSTVEAARILDVPEGTVRSRLHKARAKLRRELEKGGWR